MKNIYTTTSFFFVVLIKQITQLRTWWCRLQSPRQISVTSLFSHIIYVVMFWPSSGHERTELFIYLWVISADLQSVCGCKWTELPGLFEDSDRRCALERGRFFGSEVVWTSWLWPWPLFKPHPTHMPIKACVCESVYVFMSMLWMCVVCGGVHGQRWGGVGGGSVAMEMILSQWQMVLTY